MRVQFPIRQLMAFVVCCQLLCVAGFAADALSSPSDDTPGLVAHCYGCLGFWMYGGKIDIASVNVKQNMDQVKWPQPNWDKAKGPLFNRNSGWSMAVYGSLASKQGGEYVFSFEGDPAELRIDGKVIPLDGKAPVKLDAGRRQLAIFARSVSVKHMSGPKDQTATIHLRWKKPGTNEFEEIPAELLSHSAEDDARTVANIFDIEFKDGAMPFVGMRDYEVSVPEDGFYEFALQFAGSPWPHRYCWAMMDGVTIFQSNSIARRKFGLLGTYGETRYITKGRHLFRVSSYTDHFTHTDMTGFLEQARFGLRRIPASMPAMTLGVHEKGRNDVVFGKGERFILSIERATIESVTYLVEVREQRGADAPRWSWKVALPGGESHAVAEVEMPTDKEGAFEYTVTDAAGNVVEGPWSYVVIDPTRLPPAIEGEAAKLAKPALVDAVDCAKPEDAEHTFRDNGTSKVVEEDGVRFRVTGETGYHTVGYVHAENFNQAKNGPWRRAGEGEKAQIDYQSMDWFAYTLNVKNPGKAHMVTVWIPTQKRRYVAVQAFDQVTGQCNGAVMETGDAPRSAKLAPLSFVVWPNGKAIDLMIFCHNMPKGHPGHSVFDNKQGAAARIELFEFPDGLPPLPEAAGGWKAERRFGWMGEQVNIGIEQRTMVKFFTGDEMIPGNMPSGPKWGWYGGGYFDWKALSEAWGRLGEFSRWRGDNLVIWPVFSYSMSMLTLDRLPKGFETYCDGYGYRPVDRLRRDQLKLILLIMAKYGVTFVPDMMLHHISAEHILATDTERNYSEEGLFVSGTDGKPFKGNSGAAVLNPAHPLSRKYLVDLYGELAAKYGKYKSFGGANLRQWDGWNSNNAAWFVNANCGYDDFTVGLFEKETGLKVPVDAADPERFKKRREHLVGKEREHWFAWRRDKTISLWEEVRAEMRKHAPEAKLYGGFPPRFDEGRGLDENLLAERADLGHGRKAKFGGKGTECNELDPVDFMNFDQRGGVPHRTLDELYGATDKSYPYGLCSGDGSSIRCPPYELEGPSTKLASAPLDLIQYGGPWVLPAMDDELRNWARAWRAIPDLKYERLGGAGVEKEPVSCWSAKTSSSVLGLWKRDGVVLYLVNTTPLDRNVSVVFDGEASEAINLVSGKKLAGVRQIDTTLKPFMLAVFAADGVKGVAALRIPPEEIEVGSAAGTPKERVPPFTVDKYEVTNAQFEMFSPQRRSARVPVSPSDNCPVVNVSWLDAIAYCNWRSAQMGLEPCYDLESGRCDFAKNGYRLPTEAEWEFAAGGGKKDAYPWGSGSPSEGKTLRCDYGHYDATIPDDTYSNSLIKNLFHVLAPIGSFPEFASPCGAMDMAGSVWEWCESVDGVGDQTVTDRRVLRGGSWRSDARGVAMDARVLRGAKTVSDCVGFRCARRAAGLPAPPPYPVLPAKSAEWTCVGREGRCALTIVENAGAKRNGELVVLLGSQVLSAAPGERIATSSLRIMDGVSPVVSQVDEKDGTGDFAVAPNGTLDPDDEICFQTTLAAHETRELFIYFSASPQQAAGEVKPLEVETTESMSAQKPYRVRVANGKLEFGVAGNEKAANDNEKWKEWQAGRMTLLKADGVGMLSCWNPNGTLPCMRWPDLKEIVTAAKGPVRVVVEARFAAKDVDWFLEDVRWANDANLKNCAKTFRYQAAAGSPLIEFVEELRYDAIGLDAYKALWPYMCVSVGGRGAGSAQRVLCPGKDGKPVTLSPEQELSAKLKDGVLQDHADLGGNRDGWVACVDVEKKSGLALFGAPTVNNLSVTYHKGNKFDTLSPIFRWHYVNESIPDGRHSRRCGFMVLGTESAAEVADAHKAFMNPVRCFVGPREDSPSIQ